MCSIPGLPTPGSEVPVVITRVNLNRNCGLVELWVNMDDGRKPLYEQMRAEIQFPKRRFHGSDGKAGDLCLVCISDTWHRARVVSIQGETCNVFLIDQGQPHIATSEALAWGQNDCFLLPPETESCVLANVLCLENNWPEIPTKFLLSLPGKKFKGLVQHVLMPDRTILLDIPIVSMHICNIGVAKKMAVDEFKSLVQKCLEAQHPTQEQDVNCQLKKHDQYFYPELLTDSFELVNVTEVTNPCNIFCKLQVFSKAVKILSETIQQHYEESSDLGEAQPLTCGDPCAARGMNGRWHRSLLNEMITSDGVVEVLHVDEGKKEFVPVGDIRPLHGKFLRMPVFTYTCSLEGVKDNGTGWTTGQNDYLKSLLLNKRFVAKFNHHNVPQDVYHVILYADDDACMNDCFIEKAGPFSSERDTNVQNGPVASSFLSSLGKHCCTDLQNKATVNVDGLQEETLPCTKNQATSGADDAQIKENSKHPDPMVQINGKQNACDDYVFTVGSSVNAKVSFIESQQKFWCQPTENCDSLRHLMQDLQNHYASTHRDPLVESICVVRNQDNDMWYRARIMASHHTSDVDVRFIDYGQTQTVPLHDVCLIDPAFLRLNPQAFQCRLFNCKNSTNPTSFTDTAEFQQLVDVGASSNIGLKCTVKAVTSDEEGMLVNVVDIETPSDGACKLLTQECAPAQALRQIPPTVPSDVYNCSTYNIEVDGKEDVWITYSENVNRFYCQLDRNLHLFFKVMGSVKQLISQPRSTDCPLGLDSICFARFTDDQWHRGQVVEMSPKMKVHFVDYGQTLSVNESDVCPFPTEAGVARSVPVQAVTLGLFEVPTEVPQEVNKWFADSAIGQMFTISVVAKGEKGKLIVELFTGALNLNVKVREMMSKITQQETTCPVEQTDQQLSNSSEHGGGPNEDCLTQELTNISILTIMKDLNKVHSNDGPYARDEPSSGSISNAPAQEFEHEKTLDEGRKPTSDLMDKEMEDGQGDSEITQQLSLPSCPEGNVNVSIYKWPKISQNRTEEVYASCIAGPDHCWCQYANTEDLNMVSKLAQEAGQAQQDEMFPETLGPGSPCLAQFASDDQWYRSQVISRVDDAFRVLFIDYGNESEADVKHVRSVPPSLLEKAPQAFLCSLNGFDESKGSWNDEVYDVFYNLLVDKPLKLTVRNMDDQSEAAVPQYAVEIECEGAIVNAAMLKYWEPVADESVSIEHPQEEAAKELIPIDPPERELFLQDIQTESNMTQTNVCKVNVNTCMYRKTNFSNNKTEEVYASCIVHPHYFWCQHTKSEELSKVSELAQQAGQTQQDMMFPETLGPGSPCLAQFSSDQQWYRAQVISRVGHAFTVLFIDYGNESVVDIKNVRSVPQCLLEKAPQAFLCSLNGFDESKGSWNDNVYDDFYNLLVDKPLKLTVFNMDDQAEAAVPQYAVDVECEGTMVNAAMQKHWEPVGEECVSIEHPQEETALQDNETESGGTSLNISTVNVNACMYKKPHFSKNKKEEVYASFIVHPHYFWCQYDNPEELSKVSELAREEGKMHQDPMFPETLGPGSPCLALLSSDDQWYRAQVLHRIDDAFCVLFIDYGNKSDVDIKNVRSVPQSLLEKVPQALLCSLNGFDESKGSWNDEVYDEFENLLLDKPLKLTVFNMDDQAEAAVPQYAVDVESEGAMVNAAMQKHWEPVGEESDSIEHPQEETALQDIQTESSMTPLNVSTVNVNACMYKKPHFSKNKKEEVYASCIVHPHYFWCQYDNPEELSKVSELAQEEGKMHQDQMFPETLGPGSPCLALFSSDDQWYRGQVIRRIDDAFCVLFIDYGNESDVDIKNVRSLTQGLLEKAPQAFLCSLKGFDESKGSWDDDVYDDFNNLLVDKPLKLTVYNMDDQSEAAVPQYAVEIECEGAVINTLMEKYWKGLDTDHALEERLGSALKMNAHGETQL